MDDTNKNKSVDGALQKPSNPPNMMNRKKEVTSSPRFLVIRKSQGDYSRDSPFLIQKQLFGLVGELKNIRKIREGLLVETVSAAQSSKLLTAKRLGDNDIIVEPHKSLNVVKGVIVCRDLLNCSIEEIIEGMRSQGVIDVKRIKTKRNEELLDTASHILTFDRSSLPNYVRAAYHHLPVRHYIPNPLRCFRCQKYGHTSAKCSNEQVCVCGKAVHEGQPCEEPMKCVNCEGGHSSLSKNCPIYKQEQAIQEIRVKEKLSYPEAKKKVVVQTPKADTSYAKATMENKENTDQFVRKIVPQIVTALKEVFVCKETRKGVFDERSFKTPQIKTPSRSEVEESMVSDSESVQSYTSSTAGEKRKRDKDNDPAEENCQEPMREKKKKGWPAGKPRRPPKR